MARVSGNSFHHVRRHKTQGFLWGVFVALGLVAVSSFGALQYQQFGGEVPFITASLTPINDRFQEMPSAQVRRLQFSDIPLSSEHIRKVTLQGDRVFPLNDRLTTERLLLAKQELHRSLVAESLSGVNADQNLVGEVTDSFESLLEKSSLLTGDIALEFEFTLQEEGEIVSVPWDYVFSFLEREYLVTQDDLRKFMVKSFTVLRSDHGYRGEITLYSQPSGGGEVLQPPERE